MVIEIYDGVIREADFLEYAGFLLFFPTLSSGPIDRSRRFGEDWKRVIPRKEYLELAGEGIWKICLGLVIAPSEVQRSDMDTPAKIVALAESRKQG